MVTAFAEALCTLLRSNPNPMLWRGWHPEQWTSLVEAAQRHGVAALLHRVFAASGWPPTMPPAARTQLLAIVYDSAGHNLRLYQSLATVLQLAAPLAPIVVLKGAALGPSLYASPALRPLSDLDLLAPVAAAEPLARALVAAGYAREPLLAPELAQRTEAHLTLRGGPDGALFVELHWNLVAGSADWRAAPMEWFWRQTEPWTPPVALAAAELPGVALRLTPTAALLHGAAHLVLRHGRGAARLIWVYDLHLLASCAAIDWPALVEQARVLGWAPVVATALEQAQRCFGTQLPAAQLAQLRGQLDPRVIFFAPGSSDYAPRTTWSDLAQLDAFTRLRVLARVLLPSRAYLRAHYQPRWGHWWPLAYPYRWLKPLRVLVRKQEIRGKEQGAGHS